MADHSSNQRADIAGLTDDDPFAELTRIMGHDPRRVDVQKSDLDVAGDDLALELENELLGDLSAFSDPEPQEAATAVADDPWQPAPSDWRFGSADQTVEETAPEPTDALEETFAASFEQEMRLDVAEDDGVVNEMPIEEEAAGDWAPRDFAAHPDADETALNDTDVAEPSFADDSPAADPFAAGEADVEVVFNPGDWAQLDPDFAETETVPASAGEPLDQPADQDFADLPSTFQAEPDEVGISADEVAAFDEAPFDEAPGHDPIADDFTQPTASVGARQYMSPQDFASSVAKGSEQAAAEEPAVSDDHLDLAAQFEAEFDPHDDMTATTADAPAEPEWQAAVGEPASWTFAEEEPEPAPEPEQSTTDAAAEDASRFWRQPEPPQQPADDGPPLIDIVDVPGDARVAVEEARHIPEFHSEPDKGPETDADDLELALARAFGDAEGVPETVSAPAENPALDFPRDQYATAALGDEGNEQTDDFAFDDFADEAVEQASARYETPQYEGSRYQADGAAAYDQADTYLAADDDRWRGQVADDLGAKASPLGMAPAALRDRLPKGRSGILMAAIGGVAVLSAIAVFAFGTGGGDVEAPTLVRADSDPVKVKPDNPGGQTVPNQDNQVYQRVTGAEIAGNPEQERLVSTAEEPVDVPAPQIEPAAAKSDERLASATPDQSATGIDEAVTAMAPRRVRTMVVRPDGTMVPREEIEPAAQTAAATPTPAAQQPETVAPLAAATAIAEEPATAESAAEATTGATGVNVPAAAPVPTARPAAAPVQRQQPAAVAPSQVASAPAQPTQPVAQPAQPTAAAGDGWSVQISSQPTAESAQQSYQDMAQRHGDLLTGRGVNIVKAEVAGKGTYYRVRIPSQSKDDAIQLCSNLKAAGGSCFVSK